MELGCRCDSITCQLYTTDPGLYSISFSSFVMQAEIGVFKLPIFYSSILGEWWGLIRQWISPLSVLEM